jgi:hypothetical protein
MDNSLLCHRTPAPPAWLARQVHDLAGRRQLVGLCRAELAWARADWLAVAAAHGLAVDASERWDSPAWETARLPHEAAAARLLNVWGHLHPLERRLIEGVERLKAQREAGWPCDDTLEDVRWYRKERPRLLQAFLAAEQDYRGQRAKLGWTVSASGWRPQNAATAANLSRRAS